MAFAFLSNPVVFSGFRHSTPCVTHLRRKHHSICRHRGRVTFMSAPSRTGTASGERLIWADGISKSHDGLRTLFRDVSLTLARGAKIGLLGSNGSGKSTLLHILAGFVSPDEGKVSVKRGVRIAVVAQDLPPGLNEQQSVLDTVLTLSNQHAPSPQVDASVEYQRALDIGDEEHLSRAMLRMNETEGAWDVAANLESILTRLELPHKTKLAALSGGQRRRVAIAAALVSRPDVLLLDEVTNHLSISGILWIEEFLRDPDLTVLCISHDRKFLDNVCSDALWDMDDGELVRYGPGYTQFLEAKAARVEAQRKEIDSLSSTFRRELEWIRRQPKARATKNRARIDEFEKLSDKLREGKKALREKDRGVQALTTSTARLGSMVARFENATLRRGDTLIMDRFNYEFQSGERIGIVGQNGVGKSSILRALTGRIPLDSGNVVTGATVVFGFYDQAGVDITGEGLSEATAAVLAGRSRGKDSEMRVADFVGELLNEFGIKEAGVPSSGRNVEAQLDAQIRELNHSVALSAKRTAAAATKNPLAHMSVRALLSHFGFAPSQQHTYVSKLSGGERRRLQLMSLLLQNPNVLLLDEVTNDLDIATVSLLEDLLVSYSGVMVIVSHDRFMLDRLVDHLLVVEGNGKVDLVEGRFSDWLEVEKTKKLEARRLASKNRAAEHDKTLSKVPKKQRKMSYKEKREYESIEGEIEKHTARMEEVNRLLSEQANQAGYTQLAEWTEELAELESVIEQKTERWFELSQIADNGKSL